MDQELSIMEEEINTSVPLPDSDHVEPEVPVSLGEENAGDIVVNMAEGTNDVDEENIGVIVNDENGSGGGEFKQRRKRGRPRKEAEDLGRQEMVLTPESLATQQKRGRGRPRGTGKWQTLAASFGNYRWNSRNVDSMENIYIQGGMAVRAAAGSNFTPYTIIIPTGENISQKIWAVSQSRRASDSICVLSASGTVSIAEILQPGPLGATVKYEGRFDIVSLCGSHIYTERGHGGRRVARLSIQLVNPDGRIFGGVVGGSLIAAVPTQLVVATFRQNTKELPKARPISRSIAVASSIPTAPPNAVIGNVITDLEENQASPSAVQENSPQSCPGL